MTSCKKLKSTDSALFLFFILIISGLSEGINHHRVNEGASTSRATQEQLNDAERCEIDRYVEGILCLIIAENTSGDIQDMVENNLEELLSYIGYFKKVMTLLRYGEECSENNIDSSELLNYEDRVNYFTFRISSKLMEMMIDSCTDKFSQKFQFIYDKVSKTFSLHQLNTLRSSQCSINNPTARVNLELFYSGVEKTKEYSTESAST